MGNNAAILAGVAAGGSDGLGLTWVAPEGTTVPTTATEALNGAFVDGGICSEDGLTFSPTKTSKEIKGFGSQQVQRTLVTDTKTTFQVSFLETNLASIAVYAGKTLASVTADGTGAIVGGTAYGSSTPVRYAIVFEAIDGNNRTRFVAPNCEVSERAERKITAGEVDTRTVTITAYPDTIGNAVYEYNVVEALI